MRKVSVSENDERLLGKNGMVNISSIAVQECFSAIIRAKKKLMEQKN